MANSPRLAVIVDVLRDGRTSFLRIFQAAVPPPPALPGLTKQTTALILILRSALAASIFCS
jgi:hypothetical protein